MCVGGRDEYMCWCVYAAYACFCVWGHRCVQVYVDTYADVFRDPNLMAGGISSHSVALILYIETGP